jgi:hypothetical protein
MSQYEAIVFPLSREMIDRGISENLEVFTKFTSLSVEPGNMIYLFDTGRSGTRQIIAKAQINSTQRIPAESVWDKFGDSIIPNEQEFEEYISGRESKEIEVMKLIDLDYLDEPIDPPGNMTIAGLTLNEEEHQELQDKI